MIELSLLRMAWRTLWRTPQRTVLTAGTIGLGLAGLLLGWGYLAGMEDRLVRTVTDAMIGHAQIHARGYREDRDPQRTIPQALALLDRLDAHANVSGATPRAYTSGLLIRSSNELGSAMVMGIDPARERRVVSWGDHFARGGYPEAPNEVVLGLGLAERLALDVGDEAHLTVFNLSRRSMSSLEVRVAGLLVTGNPQLDGQLVAAPLTTVQESLGLPEAVHEVAVRWKAVGPDAGAALHSLEALASPTSEASSWRTLAPLVGKIADMQRLYFLLAVGIVFALTSFGIVNTLAMSYAERIREFGALMAVGTSPGRLVLLLFLEAACLGVVGVAFGVALWTAVHLPLTRTGIPLGEMEVAGVQLMRRVFPIVDPAAVAGLAATYVALTASVAVTTAIRVVRLDPAEALRR